MLTNTTLACRCWWRYTVYWNLDLMVLQEKSGGKSFYNSSRQIAWLNNGSPPETVLLSDISTHVLYKSSQNKQVWLSHSVLFFSPKLFLYTLLNFLKAVSTVNILSDNSSIKQHTEWALNTVLNYKWHWNAKVLPDFALRKCFQRGGERRQCRKCHCVFSTEEM